MEEVFIAMMNQAKKARLDAEYMEGFDLVEPVEAEVMMASRSMVLETDGFPHILGRILALLDPVSVKNAALVSR